MKNRPLYRNITSHTTYSIGKDRPSCGFGYVVVPYDISRTKYISQFKATGLLSIVTDFNEPINNVIVPQHLIDDVTFPVKSGEYGCLLSWINVPKTNQVIVNGLHKKPDDLQLSHENVWIKQYQSLLNKTLISKVVDTEAVRYSIDVFNDQDQRGKVHFGAKSQQGISSIDISCDGNIDQKATKSINVSAGNSVKVNIGSNEDQVATLHIDTTNGLSYKDKNNNTVTIKDDTIVVNAKNIQLGEQSLQYLVKGDEWKKYQQKLLNAIKVIQVITSTGPSSVPINTAMFDQLAQQLSKVLSQKVKTQ